LAGLAVVLRIPLGQGVRPVSELQTLTMVSATTSGMLARIRHAEEKLAKREQLPVATEHLFHAGIYARTVRLKPGTLITGALIRRATLLIVNGCVAMLVNEVWVSLHGYNVIPASAGRKQVFVTRSEVAMTMLFPTAAKTVEEAEKEFTAETDLLLSRRQNDGDTITVTGE
jgi:hypothetical protein